MASMGDVYTMTTFGQGHGYACPIETSHSMFHPGISDSTRDLKLPSAKEIPGYRISVIAEGANRGGNLLYDASYPVITI
jgi:hypothetical protein